MGRILPTGYIVQVTEEAINIIQPASGPGVFELVATWRPPPARSISSSGFKVQHAGTAGNIVAVVCETTMILTQVHGRAPATTSTAAKAVEEIQRVELAGGPASALGMRLFGGDGDAQSGAAADGRLRCSLCAMIDAVRSRQLLCPGCLRFEYWRDRAPTACMIRAGYSGQKKVLINV